MLEKNTFIIKSYWNHWNTFDWPQKIIRKWFQPQWNIGRLTNTNRFFFIIFKAQYVSCYTSEPLEMHRGKTKQGNLDALQVKHLWFFCYNQKCCLHYGQLPLQHKVEHNATVVHFSEASKQSTAVVTTYRGWAYRTGCVQFHVKMCDWWRLIST